FHSRRTAMKTYWPVFRPSGLVLAAVMLVPHWTGAQTAKSVTAEASSESAVAQVDVDRVGQQTIVRIQGDGPLKYHLSRLSDPLRVVVDFDAAVGHLDLFGVEAVAVELPGEEVVARDGDLLVFRVAV